MKVRVLHQGPSANITQIDSEIEMSPPQPGGLPATMTQAGGMSPHIDIPQIDEGTSSH